MADFQVYFQNEYAGEYRNGVGIQYKSHPFLDVMFQLGEKELLKERVMPQSRWGMEAQMFYGLRDWDPLAICRLTHGFMMSDPMWFKFPEDPPTLDWERVKLQLWD